jgi:hypothetical protein
MLLLGMGLNGNVSRCFYYFQDFAQCMKKEDDIQKVLFYYNILIL